MTKIVYMLKNAAEQADIFVIISNSTLVTRKIANNSKQFASRKAFFNDECYVKRYASRMFRKYNYRVC